MSKVIPLFFSALQNDDNKGGKLPLCCVKPYINVSENVLVLCFVILKRAGILQLNVCTDGKDKC